MVNVTIRSYTPSDYPSVKQNLIEGNLFYEEMDGEKRLEEKILRNPDSILVAELEGVVVGNVYMVEDGWGPFIYRLAVKKSQRGKGIDSRLMEEAEKRLKEKGYREVHLNVDESDSELKEYYAKRGYKEGNLYRWMSKEF